MNNIVKLDIDGFVRMVTAGLIKDGPCLCNVPRMRMCSVRDCFIVFCSFTLPV